MVCWLNLEKAMAPHSSTFAWKIPRTEEPGGLQSMGSRRVGRDWATSLSLFTFMHWRRKWQPTPVFLPRESQGWGSLVGHRLWGRRVGHNWSDLAAAAAAMVKNLPAVQDARKMRVWFLGQKDPLQKDFLLRYSGNPLQYSCLRNPMDRGVCCCCC